MEVDDELYTAFDLHKKLVEEEGYDPPRHGRDCLLQGTGRGNRDSLPESHQSLLTRLSRFEAETIP